MFLRAISLTNIRSIPSLRLDFGSNDNPRGWTYLLGENGSGKSSVLKAIGLAMSGSQSLYDLVGEPDDWIRLGTNHATIEIEFSTLDGEPREAGLEFRRGMSAIEFVKHNDDRLRQIDQAVDKSERNYFVVGYGVARHALGGRTSGISNESGSRLNPRSRAMASLFNLEYALISLEQWAMDLDYRRGEEGLVAVRSALDKLLPDVRFERIDRDRRQLLFETVDGILPLSSLSDGYQAMAAWCGDLLFQITETFADYRDPLKARGLLLVDEIDLHLHPLWQRRLVSFIKQTIPNVQVVVTTHSPLTVHQADAGELFVMLRNESGGAALQPFEGAPNRLMLHQLLQSPLFGLESLDSPQVEQVREEIRSLQGIGATASQPGKGSKKRIAELEAILEEAPTWRKARPGLERTNAVIERLTSELSRIEGKDVSLSEIAREADEDGRLDPA